jgi:hypothetical protein
VERRNLGVSVVNPRKKRVMVNNKLLYLLIFVCILVVYAYVSDDDYHKDVDNPIRRVYNCDMLIGGWLPDFPTKVIEECRKRKNNGN